MKFDFDEFAQLVFSKYKTTFNLEEVKELLKVDDRYDLDISTTSKKRLLLKSIYFSGVKSESLNNAEINFSQDLNSGLTMWIADNLRGKSSLFKIIQFALTGIDKIKGDVAKWLKVILLNFEIDGDDYSVFLDLQDARLTAKLFNNKIISFEDINKTENKLVFQANTKIGYEKQIQDFFFEQFAYYPLQWTSKSPIKAKNELLVSNTSWKTYFKSIYLESKDTYSLMFGDQEKKVFHMLLGLELTYPINRLTIKKELLEFDNAKNKSLKTDGNEEPTEIIDLKNRAEEIEKQLTSPITQTQNTVNISALYEEYEKITNQIKNQYSKEISIENKIQENRRKLNVLNVQLDSRQGEFNKISKEIESSKKRVGDLQEYVEIGIFFSNLDIKHCPNCNHSVPESKKKSEIESKTCSLCSESVDAHGNEVNSEIYKEKIENLTLTSKKLEQEQINIKNNIEAIKREHELVRLTIQSLEKDQKFIGDTKQFKNRLEIIENNINKIKEEANPLDTGREKLIAEKAVIDFRLKLFDTQITKQKNTSEDQIKLLSYAIEELNNYRFKLSEKILHRLSKLMLLEINGFGVSSITDIKINNNFDILYEQDGDFITFDNIAEGEQLRAKLAFYLSLIQLEVEQKVGCHSKLLIIDSPAKEEGDSKYLEGLSKVLKNIDKRFGDKLQILIGTAERDLAGVATSEHILPENEFLF